MRAFAEPEREPARNKVLPKAEKLPLGKQKSDLNSRNINHLRNGVVLFILSGNNMI